MQWGIMADERVEMLGSRISRPVIGVRKNYSNLPNSGRVGKLRRGEERGDVPKGGNIDSELR